MALLGDELTSLYAEEDSDMGEEDPAATQPDTIGGGRHGGAGDKQAAKRTSGRGETANDRENNETTT